MLDQLPVEKLEEITIAKGAHKTRGDELCAMELVSWLAGEKHSDAPECASPVLTRFFQSWNDGLNDADRNRLLKPLLPRLIGTRGSAALEEKRTWMITDWVIREYLPAWLDLAKLTNDADAVRRLPEVTSSTFRETLPTLNAAREKSAAAWAAAGDAAGAAARAAAGAAARAALMPTVDQLQLSAARMIERMIEARE